MKKILCLLMLCCLAVSLVACPEPAPEEDIYTKSEGVMTWEEYMAADFGEKVVIEAYVQGKQNWWDNMCTLYLQDGVGGYFGYELPCSEEDYAKLTDGTKVRITGYKAEFAGEIEIVSDELDPAKIEILDGNYVADPIDLTSKLGTDELAKYQNMKVAFNHMTFVSLEYKNGEPGDDIYLTLSYNGELYSFCVERHLTGPETDVYKTVQNLKAGDHVNIVGFAYWYNGINTHITSISSHTH